MTEGVIAAIIGVGGMVVVAITGAVVQIAVTRKVINAERSRLVEQLFGETNLRSREKRHDQLLDSLADLLAAADPQISPGGDYGRAVQLIHRVQLLLDRNDPLEKRLNGALNALGLRLQEYIGVRHLDIDNKSLETRALLAAQSEVTESGKAVLSRDAT